MIARLPLPAPRFLRCLPLALVLLLGACSSVDPRGPDHGPVYTPRNVRGPDVWPEYVRRVAVLPAFDATNRLTAEFINGYDSSWRRALDHSQRAEFISLSRSLMTTWFSRASFSSSDPLPFGMLGRIGRETSAQAVLFLDLTHCSPYPPLTLSYRARLVDLKSGDIIWMADEIVDAADVETARGARRFARANSSQPGDAAYGVVQSPTRFADYAFQAVTAVLPPRTNPISDDKKNTLTPKKNPNRADNTK
ncbi:MAG: hypothetical protein NTU80_10440 [Verrucomicrobia bacterium]|nr:hypothetical protein [Verrucomicrobiota bacterium]